MIVGVLIDRNTKENERHLDHRKSGNLRIHTVARKESTRGSTKSLRTVSYRGPGRRLSGWLGRCHEGDRSLGQGEFDNIVRRQRQAAKGVHTGGRYGRC